MTNALGLSGYDVILMTKGDDSLREGNVGKRLTWRQEADVDSKNRVVNGEYTW